MGFCQFFFFTCVSSFARKIEAIKIATGRRFTSKATHGSMDEKAVINVPRINRNIAPGVSIDEINRQMW